MAYGLTARQAQLLRYITGYQLAHGGVSPTFTEMMAGIGSRNKARIHSLLGYLGRGGFVSRLFAKHQAIEVLEPIAIPHAPDGAPLYAVPGFGEAG